LASTQDGGTTNLLVTADLILFDLDGTLIDSGADIAKSVNLLRRSESLPPLATPVIESFVGNGVRRLLRRAFEETLSPIQDETNRRRRLDALHEAYRATYQAHLLDQTRMFPGVEEALNTLRGRIPMAILTNKPFRETEMILEGLSMSAFFDEVCGGDTFARKKPDPIGAETLLARFGVTAPNGIMVGDSIVDQGLAESANLPFCLVTYGLGSSAVTTNRCRWVVDDLSSWSQRLVAPS